MELVSVIIPTYKGSSNLKRAIQSVIIQTYKNVEIIVVDDNPPDSDERKKTEEVIRYLSSSKINYIKHEKNKNGAAARNTGMKFAEGKYICFLDDDDYILPERIAAAVEYLKKNKQYAGVCCGVIFVNDDCIVGKMNISTNLHLVDFLLNDNIIGTGSNIFLTKECVDEVSGFDETFIRHQDVEYMIRVLEQHQVGTLESHYIVKCRSGHDNTPSYSKMIDVKQMFDKKFKKHINGLSDNEKKQYYERKSTLLYNVALLDCKENLVEARKALLVYRALTLNEHLKFYLSYLGVLKSDWYIYFKKVLKRSIYGKRWDAESVMYKLYKDYDLFQDEA